MSRYQQNKELYRTERRMFYVVVVFIILASASYMYFLCASVAHVVMRKEINQEIGTLASNIGELESRYIEAQHTVSEEIATMHGYVKTSEKVFVESTGPTLVLSKNNDS